MAKSGKRYELMVKAILDAEVAKGFPLESVLVEHNRLLLGKSGHQHQIDVVIRVRVLGVQIIVLVECKDYEHKVGVDEVSEFAYRISDIGAHKGIFVTNTGFQRGAVSVAKAEGIALVVAKNMEWLPGLSSPIGEIIAHREWIVDALSYLRGFSRTPPHVFDSMESAARPELVDLIYSEVSGNNLPSDQDQPSSNVEAGPIRDYTKRTEAILSSNSLDRRFYRGVELKAVDEPAEEAKGLSFFMNRREGVAFELVGENGSLLARPKGMIDIVLLAATWEIVAKSELIDEGGHFST